MVSRTGGAVKSCESMLPDESTTRLLSTSECFSHSVVPLRPARLSDLTNLSNKPTLQGDQLPSDKECISLLVTSVITGKTYTIREFCSLHHDTTVLLDSGEMNHLKQIEQRLQDAGHHSVCLLSLLEITGPPRTGKSFKGLSELYSVIAPCYLAVTRTKDNARDLHRQTNEHDFTDEDTGIDFSDVTINIDYFGTATVCPSIEEDAENAHIHHRSRCEGERSLHKIPYEYVEDLLDEEQDWNNQLWEQVYEDGYCPRTVQDMLVAAAHRSGRQAAIFLTYAGLKTLINRMQRHNADILQDAAVMLDEFRHTPNILPIEEHIQINDTPSERPYEALLQDWQDTYRCEIEEHLPQSGKQLAEMREQFFDYLEDVLAARLQMQEMREAWINADEEEKTEIRQDFDKNDCIDPADAEPTAEHYGQLQCLQESGETELFPQEHLLNQVTKPNLSVPSTVSKELSKKLTANPDNTELQRLYRLKSLIETLDTDTVQANFDFIPAMDKKKRSLSLILHHRDDEDELRPYLTLLRAKAQKLITVDATPFPSEYHNFIFKHPVDIERKRVETDYSFNIVIEGTKSGIRTTHRSLKNSNRFLNKCTRLNTEMVEDLCFFGRNKQEQKLLKEHGLPTVSYARSGDVEGVDMDGDYVISAGMPVQNIHSEGYRRFYIARSVGSNVPKNALWPYQRTKALQELVQHSFRTAERGGHSGAVWMNTAWKMYEHAESMWSWLEQLNTVKMRKGKQVPEKVHQMKHGLRHGRLPERWGRKEVEIAENVLYLLAKYDEMQTEELIDALSIGSKSDRRNVIDLLVNEGLILKHTGKYNRKIYRNTAVSVQHPLFPSSQEVYYTKEGTVSE